MKIMTLVALFFAAIIYKYYPSHVAGDCIDFSKARSFTIYKWPSDGNIEELKIRTDTMKGKVIAINEVKEVLSGVKCEKKNGYLWKGYYFGKVIDQDGARHFLLVSEIGEMLYEPDTKLFYPIAQVDWAAWHHSLTK